MNRSGGRRQSGTMAVVAVVLLLACGPGTPAQLDAESELRSLAQRVLSPLSGELQLRGLREPVEVLRDRWGVAHIYAANVDDLFFTQGLVAAQDRLWQMEWWRRFGEGRLSEVLGPAAIAHDRFARLLRYRGDMDAEWQSYHPEGRRIVGAFVAGVNAWIEQVRDDPPVEFQLTGIRPEPWHAGVPILRMAGLAMTGDNLREIDLALRVAALGAEEANRLAEPDPFRPLEVPRGLQPERIAGDLRQSILGPSLPVPPLLPRFQELLQEQPIAALWPQAERRPGDGSNNWVVSGELSRTGMPLLANDPHRAITLPSLRYLVHLNAPGWNVIGSGEPALPGVAIGHNERVAWGLTIVGIDQGDIFVERLNPENPDQVWHDGAWQDLHTEIETAKVAGEAPRELVLQFSHHGPVLYKDLEQGLAYAFRTVLTEPGTAGYLGSLRVDQAHDWDSYREALRAWKVPSENMIYADVDGEIGWVASGLTPRRAGWSGRLPVPGTGEYEWQGFRPLEELPQEHDPERGFIATANHNIMPAGYEPPLGYRWETPWRYERLVEVLSSGGPFGIDDFISLQQDTLSRAALANVALLREMSFADEPSRRAAELLTGWDGVLAADSPAAALYKAWQEAGGEAEQLAVAVERLEQEQGAGWAGWRWGVMNRVRFDHPLVDAFDAGFVERPGDDTTVNLGDGGHGPSFRQIIDLSDWDASRVTSTPGQSGQPESPHYGDLLESYAAGRYFPLTYTRAAVEAVTEHRLVLRPAR